MTGHDLERRITQALHDEADRLPDLAAATIVQRAPSSHPEMAAGDFDAFYSSSREAVYRALTLVLADRDAAIDATDRALGRAYRRWRKVARMDDPLGWVFGEGVAWAAKHGGKQRHGISGFRLPTDDTGGDPELIEAFHRLPVSYRASLVARHYLGWDRDRAAAALRAGHEAVEARNVRGIEQLGETLRRAVSEIELRIGPALVAEAGRSTLPLSRLQATKGREWSRRASVALGAAAAVLILVGGVALALQAFRAEPEIVVGPTTPPGGGAVVVDPEGTKKLVEASVTGNIEWTPIDIGMRGEGDLSAIAYGPAGFLALGNDWSGRSGSNQIAFLSEDGFIWESVPSPMPGREGWVGQMTASAAGYAAVGETWDNVTGQNEPWVFTSPDGIEWNTVPLPGADEVEEIAGFSVRWHTSPGSIVATKDGGWLVTGSQWADTGGDPSRILAEADFPEDIGGNIWDWGWGTSTNADGEVVLELYGEFGVRWRGTFEEIGLDPALAVLFGGGRSVMWSSSDGVEWELVSQSGGGVSGIWNIVSNGERLVGMSWDNAGPVLWSTVDGDSWTRSELERGAEPNHLAAIDGTFVAVGRTRDGGASWTSPDGITWTKHLDDDLNVSWFNVMRPTPLGLLAIGQGEQGATREVLARLTVGDRDITISDRGEYRVFDLEGNELAVVYEEDVVYTTDGSVELTDPETGDVIVSITQEELRRAWDAAWREAEGGFIDQGPGTTRVLVSTDGIAWDEIVTDIDPGFSPYQAAAGPNVIVLVGWQEQFIDFGGGGGLAVWVGAIK